jgi:cytidine deaminase
MTKKTAKKTPTKSQLETLFKAAVEARKKAYAPYSKYHIGSAVRTADGKVFSGSNVENASYGGTVCAERTAIWKAVTEGAEMPLKEVMVVSDQKDPWPPCGMCRQVISEFGGPKTKIWIANTKEVVKVFNFDEIFPEAFSPEHLK